MKRLVLLIICFVLLVSCKNYTTEEMVYDLIENKEISCYREQEIVLLMETEEYLLRRFLISYDLYRKAYKTFFYVGQDIDNINANAFILRTGGDRDFKLSSLIGLSKDEMFIKFKENNYNEYIYKFLLINEGSHGSNYSISNVYNGYEPGESYVYVRLEDKSENAIYTTTYKYHFRTIEDKKKVFVKNMVNAEFHIMDDIETLEEFYNKTNVYYHENVDGEYKEVLVEYPINFDIYKFAVEYFDYNPE